MRLLPVPARLRVYASSDSSHNESITCSFGQAMSLLTAKT